MKLHYQFPSDKLLNKYVHYKNNSNNIISVIVQVIPERYKDKTVWNILAAQRDVV